MKSKRIEWIDSLKYIACLGIVWEHFYRFFINTETNPTALIYLSKYIDKWNLTGVSLEASSVVRFFCIISGFLVGYKTITSFKELIKSIIKRYLRFVVPLFFCGLIILLIQCTIGFKVDEACLVLNREYSYSNFSNRFSFIDVLKLAFLFDDYMNGPCWTIMPVFFGSIIIYILSYISNKFKLDDKKTIYLYVLAFVLMIIKYDINSISMAASVLGACINKLVKCLKINNKLANFGVLTTLFMSFYGHLHIYDYLVGKGIDMPLRFDMYGYGSCLWGGC